MSIYNAYVLLCIAQYRKKTKCKNVYSGFYVRQVWKYCILNKMWHQIFLLFRIDFMWRFLYDQKATTQNKNLPVRLFGVCCQYLLLYIYIIILTNGHSGSIFPNFLPIIGSKMKIKNFLLEINEIYLVMLPIHYLIFLKDCLCNGDI